MITDKFKLFASVELMEIDEEWLILHPDNFTITKINSTGAFILQQLKEQIAIDDIVKLMEIHYGVEASKAREDIMAFFKELQETGIVEHETV